MPHFVDNAGATFEMVLQDQDGTAMDVSAATTVALRFLKPNGVDYLDKTATFVTDGTDGRIEYEIEAGVLDVEGWWTWQAQLLFGAVPKKWSPRRFYVNRYVGQA
jgi:hypothetical protein